jgi:cytochrome P450
MTALESTVPSTDWDPGDPEFAADPHRYWRQVRRRHPVCWSARTDSWLVVSDHAVRAALDHPDLSTDVYADYGPAPIPLPSSFELAPQENASFRSRVSALLSQHRNMYDGVAQQSELLARRTARDGFDVVSEYAEPLASRLVLHWLGIGAEQLEFLTALLVAARDIETAAERRAAGALFTERLLEVLDARRRYPSPDLLSSLSAGWERLGGDDRDLVAFLAPMIYSLVQRNGTRLLVHTLWPMLELPQLQEAVRRGGTAVARRCVEEAARWEPINPVVPRRAAQELVLSGQTISAGDNVMLVLSAACHDESVHVAPEQFRLSRPERHLAFGHGVHACIGRGIAIRVAAAALTALLREHGSLSPQGLPEVEVLFGRTCLQLPARRKT